MINWARSPTMDIMDFRMGIISNHFSALSVCLLDATPPSTAKCSHHSLSDYTLNSPEEGRDCPEVLVNLHARERSSKTQTLLVWSVIVPCCSQPASSSTDDDPKAWGRERALQAASGYVASHPIGALVWPGLGK